MVYLNFAFTFVEDKVLIEKLLTYGVDTIPHKLEWWDKLTILDTCLRIHAPYALKVFNKYGIDLLMERDEVLMS